MNAVTSILPGVLLTVRQVNGAVVTNAMLIVHVLMAFVFVPVSMWARTPGRIGDDWSGWNDPGAHLLLHAGFGYCVAGDGARVSGESWAQVGRATLSSNVFGRLRLGAVARARPRFHGLKSWECRTSTPRFGSRSEGLLYRKDDQQRFGPALPRSFYRRERGGSAKFAEKIGIVGPPFHQSVSGRR